MGAFFSSTDDANENATQFYGVWGKIKDQKPQFAFRYCSGDAKVQCCPSVLFDWPMVTEKTTVEISSDIEGFETQTYVEENKTIFQGPFPKIDYPNDWMGQHSKRYEVPYAKKYDNGSFKKNNKSYKTYNNRSIGGGTRFDDSFFFDEPYDQADLFELQGFDDMPYSYYEMPKATSTVGLNNARIKKMTNPKEDEDAIKVSSQYDVDVITKNYHDLGLDRVIEASVDALRTK